MARAERAERINHSRFRLLSPPTREGGKQARRARSVSSATGAGCCRVLGARAVVRAWVGCGGEGELVQSVGGEREKNATLAWLLGTVVAPLRVIGETPACVCVLAEDGPWGGQTKEEDWRERKRGPKGSVFREKGSSRHLLNPRAITDKLAIFELSHSCGVARLTSSQSRASGSGRNVFCFVGPTSFRARPIQSAGRRSPMLTMVS